MYTSCETPQQCDWLLESMECAFGDVCAFGEVRAS